ncbi:hypothetical protein RN001_013822 [Aquatica leii]|uniref:Uncharacterized protein n=1 Tax=Aquatica leii TaxID=1421715 RepID=A0AAN7PS84_9COLE|nr:hypothetical protein RN001_013822 [Aquatica leii]
MTYSQELDNNSNRTIKLKLYQNVENVPTLRQQIMNRKLNCCIIKPSLVFHPFQVVVAANKAVVADKITTKTIYTEILFNLSLSKNITQSLQKYGIEDGESELLVAVIDKNDCSSTLEDVCSHINGDEIDISQLSELRNMTEIQKAYKLSDVESKDDYILNSIVTKIASKDFI